MEEIWLSPMTKATEKQKNNMTTQKKNTKTNFDYASIADRFRNKSDWYLNFVGL